MRYYTLRHKKYAIIAQSTGERGEVMITVEQINPVSQSYGQRTANGVDYEKMAG